jgi:archaellum biogenesis ATPase FlaH
MENNQLYSPNLLHKGPDKDKQNNILLNPQFEFDKYRIGVKDIKAEAERLIKQGNEAKENKGLFTVKTASSWIEQAKGRPIPSMLFGEFWFEGELCILFADTNLGKSILAVQIGNSISKGEYIKGFKLETSKQPILYFDFELSDKQFENRYSIKFEQHYSFDNNFIRVEINPDAEIPERQTFEDYLNHSLERAIKETGARVLIIDNLTYLKNETEKAKDALPLMKRLKALKNRYNLSILALAHTPKRDLSKPITRNDLQGSKMLINFCDSSFAIGESSNDKNTRYLKQIKARNTEIIYDTENVCICHIEKPYNFLQFEFLNYGTEREHLRQVSETEKTELESSIKELLQTEPGLTAYSIAKKLCKDETRFNSFKVKVSRIVNRISNNSNN